MEYMKHKIIKESLKFIELCQTNVILGEMSVETYNMLTDVKICFLKNMFDKEITNLYLRNKYLNRTKNILKTNNLIHFRYCSKKASF
ncbi:UNVERIFIED_CONTAM: hypothetical protein Cloal_1182 [Acetivibrio alkalicellulosi]